MDLDQLPSRQDREFLRVEHTFLPGRGSALKREFVQLPKTRLLDKKRWIGLRCAVNSSLAVHAVANVSKSYLL